MTKDEALKLCDYLECNDASLEAQCKAAAFIREALGIVKKKREWVGLTDAEAQLIYDMGRTPSGMMEMVEAKLKEKNHGL